MRLTSSLKESIRLMQEIIKHDHNIIDIDKMIIRVKAGSGGNGMSRYNGRGGDGGSIYLISKEGIAFKDIPNNLIGMTVKAENGVSSQKKKLIGDRSKDVYIHVPIGVEATNSDDNILLARCNKPYQKYLVARGGRGGDATNSYRGERGESLNIALNLKLRPNVGLVGFPNAGKSTLLKAFVPNKSVKIAPYPFTTVKPQIAFWAEQSEKKFSSSDLTLSIADLPGLIEGASRNRGRGYQFLKHLEYSDILLMVIDCNGFLLSDSTSEYLRSPLETVALLNKELEDYDTNLTKKPCILYLNKADTVAPEIVRELSKLLHSHDWILNIPTSFHPRYPILFDSICSGSARLGHIDSLKQSLIRIYSNISHLSLSQLDDSNNRNKLL